MTGLTALLLALTLVPLLTTLINLPLLRRPTGLATRSRVSVLIPARDEEATIATALTALAASAHPDFEVLVLDDGSTDRTAAIVAGFAAGDTRIRLHRSVPPLPPGWSGKMHACHQLAELADGELLLFVDADVTLAPSALPALDGFMAARPHVGLASGVPRQITSSLAEKLVVPLIDFLLLGYLPLVAMRATRSPGFGAACGQLVLVRRQAYGRTGGHAKIPHSRHDGVHMARLFRRNGIATDLFDASGLATCRMYVDWRSVWSGFSKNATQGLATPAGLPIWTVLLGGGQVIPFLLLPVLALTDMPGEALKLDALACLCSWLTRFAVAGKDGSSTLGAALHPLGIAILLAIQWSARLDRLRGRPAAWRGRTYKVE